MTTYDDNYDRFIQSQKAQALNLGIDVKRDYGASGSANTFTGNMAEGSNVLTIPGPLASPPDFLNGQGISVVGAGVGGALLVGTVISGGGTATMVLSVPAETSVSGATVQHDDTAAIQAAINSAMQTSGVVLIPTGVFNISSPITINNNVKVVGCGVFELFGSQGTASASLNNSINFPQVSPYLQGSIIQVTATATNAINITSASSVVDLEDFGIIFKSAYANTGHGIYAVPPVAYSGLDNGVMSSKWKNIKVFGHDGDHYAFYLVNPIYLTLDHLRHYGGGGFHLENNGEGHYGNTTIVHPYGQLYVGGTAHGIHLKVTLNELNMITMVGPQVTVADYSVAGVTAPTSAQYTLLCDDTVTNLSIAQPDFETNVSAGFQLPTQGRYWVDPSGYISNTSGDAAIQYVVAQAGPNNGVTRQMGSDLGFTIQSNEPSGYAWPFGAYPAKSNYSQGPRTDGTLGYATSTTVFNSEPTASLNGTTAGTAVSVMPEQGTAYKKVVIALNGYENTTATAQTISFPTAFTQQATITSQPSGFGATLSPAGAATGLVLPVSMTGAVSGVLIVEGM